MLSGGQGWSCYKEHKHEHLGFPNQDKGLGAITMSADRGRDLLKTLVVRGGVSMST